MHNKLKIVYSPHYDIRLGGIEKLHPFDSCKYGRAWASLQRTFGKKIEGCLIEPQSPVSNDLLLHVHSSHYLESLRKSKNIAQALELPVARILPRFVLERCIVNPMRYAVSGTLLAAREALQSGIAINLAGGYHHASRQSGEGFCLFADVGVAVAELRTQGLLKENDKILIIDLDAHQGNGNEHIFRDDDQVYIMDMYNKDLYPHDVLAKERIDMDVPVVSGIADESYLSILTETLPKFINNIARPRLVFYNAGTDILAKDPLGSMNVSAKGILQRDIFVFNLLINADFPFVVLPSGGYTQSSYKLIADSVQYLLRLSRL